MLVLFLFLLVLPFEHSQSYHRQSFHRRVQKEGYLFFDCLDSLEVRQRWQVAQCLLQINTLEKTMQCADWKHEERLTFDISNNLYARDVDIVPSLDNYDTTSNILKYPTWDRGNDQSSNLPHVDSSLQRTRRA
jgi:hypothetical protein